MLALALRVALAAMLVAAALLKLASPGASRAALATFGIRGSQTQRALWSVLVSAELALAVGVLAGWAPAAYFAAVLQVVFAAAMGRALAAGRAGAPCGCFGARSRVRPAGIVRNLTLAAAFVALPSLPEPHPSTEDWLTLGLVAALLAVAGLTVAVLALAREVGELRLAVGPQAALEVAHEGPEVGSRTDLIRRFSPEGPSRFALAVFTSEGCHACDSVAPAVDLLASDPLVIVRSFDERRDADAWDTLGVPGSPYAVALGLDGTVLAKGTFNNLPQLESVLGTAERRAVELAHA